MESDSVLNHPIYIALLAENAELRAENTVLRAELSSLREAMNQMRKLLESFQEKASKDSHNSHKPPGSDGPQAPPRPPIPATGRKRGGQKGRIGKARKPLPEGSEQRTVDVPLPDCCPHCNYPIPPEAMTHTVTHRVCDLVRQLTEVIAFRLQHGICGACHKVIKAELPPEAGVGEIGHRLRGLAAYLRTQGRMSIGPLRFYFQEVLGIDISRGWLHKSGGRVSEALEPVWKILLDEIRAADVVNMDETGFGRKDRDWIWVALSARTVLFHFSGTRSAEALKVILPENFAGVLCTDRYNAYKTLKEATRQYCWAHLRRELVAMSEAVDPTVANLGKKMLADQERIFDLWHRFRQQEIRRIDLRKQSAIILARLKHNLSLASVMDHKASRLLGRDLIKHWGKLWTFLRIDGVEPTNNSAERALRPLVILKRIFQRLPSTGGKQFFERLFSTGMTARVRGVPYFDWLIRALHANHQGLAPPVLA